MPLHQECQRTSWAGHNAECKKWVEAQQRVDAKSEEGLKRVPSATQSLLTNVSEALMPTQQEAVGVARTDGGGLHRSESVWDRVQSAMKEEVDEQGFKSQDDRLEYFLKRASLVRVKPGQKVVSAGAMRELLRCESTRCAIGRRRIALQGLGGATIA